MGFRPISVFFHPECDGYLGLLSIMPTKPWSLFTPLLQLRVGRVTRQTGDGPLQLRFGSELIAVQPCHPLLHESNHELFIFLEVSDHGGSHFGNLAEINL